MKKYGKASRQQLVASGACRGECDRSGLCVQYTPKQLFTFFHLNLPAVLLDANVLMFYGVANLLYATGVTMLQLLCRRASSSFTSHLW